MVAYEVPLTTFGEAIADFAPVLATPFWIVPEIPYAPFIYEEKSDMFGARTYSSLGNEEEDL